MKVKIYGTPGKRAKAKIRNPITRALFIKKLFQFDANGEAVIETDNYKDKVIKAIFAKYRHEEVPATITLETTAEPSETLRHCRKCDFTCTGQGELMRHYRECHPKPKEE